MSDVLVWEDPELDEVWVTDGSRRVKVDPLVLEGMRMLHEKEYKELESEIDKLKSINQQLWMLLTCNFFEHVEKWINSQLSGLHKEEE